MPQVDAVNDIDLVVNDEDVLLTSARDSSSETEVDSGFSKSTSPIGSTPQASVR